MYDLDNAAEESEAKKGVLMALVKHYAADDFDTSNLPIKAWSSDCIKSDDYLQPGVLECWTSGLYWMINWKLYKLQI